MAREAKLIIAAGMKKVGKTYTTLKEINNYIIMTKRKVLILDVNNEYGAVKADHNPNFAHVKGIAVEDIPKWTLNGIVEIRRVLPITSDGKPLTPDELQGIMKYILENFKNGVIVLEDLTKIVSDSVSQSLISMLATQRHASVDVYIHFQTIQKVVHPKMWGLSNVIRLHHCEDTVSKHASKIDNPVGLYICENLLEIMSERTGDRRPCVYYHKEEKKITGAFSQAEFERAIEMYLQDNITLFNRELAKVDLKTGKKIHKDRPSCYSYLVSKYKEQFYGNKK